MKKCVTCDHDLFTTFDNLTEKYYCIVCHPNKVQIVTDRREYDDLILGIDSSSLSRDEESRLTKFYEQIIVAKDKEINLLRSELEKQDIDEITGLQKEIKRLSKENAILRAELSK